MKESLILRNKSECKTARIYTKALELKRKGEEIIKKKDNEAHLKKEASETKVIKGFRKEKD